MIEVEGLAIRAVAFDMDGLMFDSERIAIGLWRARVSRRLGNPRSPLLLALSAILRRGEASSCKVAWPEFPYDKVQARGFSSKPGITATTPYP